MNRAITSLLAVVVLLCTPMLVPDVHVQQTDSPQAAETMTADTTPTVEVPAIGIEVSVTKGGEAQAWNLPYELCRMGVPHMCDIYEHGVFEGWWD